MKVRDLFRDTSADYDGTSATARTFFATIQNKLIFAVTGHTAAELVLERADPSSLTMGLTTWESERIRTSDVDISKNYLREKGITQLNRLTVDPDPRREQATGFDGWRRAGVDTMLVVPRASRYGQAVSSYYIQAWLDKYRAADPTADDRLLATEFTYREPVAPGPTYQSVALRRDDQMSIYFCSGYDFVRRDGGRARDTDLGRAGCPSER